MTSKEIKRKKTKSGYKETTKEIKIEREERKVKPHPLSLYESKVEPNLELIGAWVRDGLTYDDIAANLGIGVSSLKNYRKKYPELNKLWEKEKQILDYVHMINAYQKRAEGYTTIEEEKEYKVLEDGTEPLLWVKRRERHVPADPRALENWIQLRMVNDPMWGKLREILHDKNIELGGEGGLVFIPAKKVLELEQSEGNNMDAPTETG